MSKPRSITPFLDAALLIQLKSILLYDTRPFNVISSSDRGQHALRRLSLPRYAVLWSGTIRLHWSARERGHASIRSEYKSVLFCRDEGHQPDRRAGWGGEDLLNVQYSSWGRIPWWVRTGAVLPGICPGVAVIIWTG